MIESCNPVKKAVPTGGTFACWRTGGYYNIFLKKSREKRKEFDADCADFEKKGLLLSFKYF